MKLNRHKNRIFIYCSRNHHFIKHGNITNNVKKITLEYKKEYFKWTYENYFVRCTTLFI